MFDAGTIRKTLYYLHLLLISLKSVKIFWNIILHRGGCSVDKNETKRRFKVALSFPCNYRELARKIAHLLEPFFTKKGILFDEFHSAEFARQDLDVYLQKLYKDDSDLIVVFIGSEYFNSQWGQVEYRAIRSILNASIFDKSRVMFIRCNNDQIDGFLASVDGALDASLLSVDEIKNAIILRYYDAIHGIDVDKRWKYNILIFDDNIEQLEMLHQEVFKLFGDDCRYTVRITALNSSNEVLLKSSEIDFDVFVLDIARNPSLSWQVQQHEYYGRSMFERLLNEKPNLMIKSKFYILSRLSLEASIYEFEGVSGYRDIEFVEKRHTSNTDMAKKIKSYLDRRFYESLRMLNE